MRIGQLRGVLLATALISTLGTVSTVLADGFIKTIPREVLAQDLNTGQPYFAPPVPWGHYAKSGVFDHYYPKAGHFGFLHHGCENRGGSGHGLGGLGCKGCGGSGCGLGSKCGLFHRGAGSGDGCGLGGGSGGDACGDPGCAPGHGSARRIKDCGLCKNKGCGLCQSSSIGDPMYVTASAQSVPVRPVVSAQSFDPNGGTLLCDSCSGKGCGKCGGCGLLHRKMADPCGSCGGAGCGKCGLGGLLHHGSGDLCGSCGGAGCGKCGLFNKGAGCGACGGRGCNLCSNLKSKLGGLLHHKGDKIKYFVGPGGPVPLTPGYVPYTVTTRSPRDFLAFPPYTPSGF